MALSGSEIQSELDDGYIEIEREEGDLSVEPSSIDLHLGDGMGWYEERMLPISVWEEETYPRFVERYNNGEILIQSGEFLLCHTQEVVNLPPDRVGLLEGRSSVGRLGLFVENAGLVDGNFHGDLTLELFNASKNTIVLKPGMRIVQMMMYEHGEEPDRPYSAHNNKYQGQRGPTPSRLYEDF